MDSCIDDAIFGIEFKYNVSSIACQSSSESITTSCGWILFVFVALLFDAPEGFVIEIQGRRPHDPRAPQNQPAHTPPGLCTDEEIVDE